MSRRIPRFLALILGLAATAVVVAADKDAGTRTGWFADEWCAAGRVKSGNPGPSNRDCAQKCIAKGAKMIFIDEKAKAYYEVANPEAAKGQESHYVEVAGVLDGDGKTFKVDSVKVLETYKASCQMPKEEGEKKSSE
jgi:hypothetical protein